MGCGTSTSLPPKPHWLLHQEHLDLKQGAIANRLVREDRNTVKIGIFGLRSSGKSSMLNSLRRHLTAPDHPSSIPLPPPTEAPELFTGPVAGVQILCVDTPGLPCTSRSSIRSFLSQLNRVVWVVDSTQDWTWDLSCMELIELWKDVLAAPSLAAAAASSSNAANHARGKSESDLGRPLPAPQAQRKNTFHGQAQWPPQLHVVFAKQRVEASNANANNANSIMAGGGNQATSSTSPKPTATSTSYADPPTLSPQDIAGYMHLSTLLPNAAVHGFSCLYDGTKMDSFVQSVLGPTSTSGTGLGTGTTRRSPALFSQQQIRERRRSTDQSGSPAIDTAVSPGIPPPLLIPQASLNTVQATDQLQLALPVLPTATKDGSRIPNAKDLSSTHGPLMSPSHVHLVYPFHPPDPQVTSPQRQRRQSVLRPATTTITTM